VLLGVCGGFQMLGKIIRDPLRVEGGIGEDTALGLLDMETEMLPEKITRQAFLSTRDSPVLGKGLIARGYEIHMGIAKFNAAYPALFSGGDAKHPLHSGVASEDGTVIGTYIHGFLDNDELRREFLRYIRDRRGLPHPEDGFEYRRFREEQLNRLAEMIERHVDMKQVNAMIQNAC
jgi:adenosylcobyric acid synthase